MSNCPATSGDDIDMELSICILQAYYTAKSQVTTKKNFEERINDSNKFIE